MRRNLLKSSHVLALGVLTAGLVSASFLTHPAAAMAAPGAAQASVSHTVTFVSNGAGTDTVSSAPTVGAFLEERGIVASAGDYVQPDLSTPLSDHMIISYQAAVPVKIAMHSGTKRVSSSAGDVGGLLEEQGIALGPHDIVKPSLSNRLTSGETIRVVRVVEWTKKHHTVIPTPVKHRIVFNMKPGTHKVLAKGHAGVRETVVQFEQHDGGAIKHHVVASAVVRTSAPRIVEDGAGEFAAYEHMAKRGIDKTSYVAAAQMHMVATAYTSSCAGCNGVTAMGYRAGHGVVAVDPHYIPLGSKLYIPGYGYAIAGDTGGAIRGNRIDLGFNSVADAVEFGRREITVYRLK
jgi:3D (Asp-Asp-Asp) domain-containing protein